LVGEGWALLSAADPVLLRRARARLLQRRRGRAAGRPARRRRADPHARGDPRRRPVRAHRSSSTTQNRPTTTRASWSPGSRRTCARWRPTSTGRAA